MKCTPVFTERVVVTETKVKEVTGVTLELSVKEAQRLLAIVGSICGGGPIRETTSQIYNILYEQVNEPRKVVRNPFTGTPNLKNDDVKFG